eukprot:2578163-Lingulodinium_polyedra.AAC.1
MDLNNVCFPCAARGVKLPTGLEPRSDGEADNACKRKREEQYRGATTRKGLRPGCPGGPVRGRLPL